MPLKPPFDYAILGAGRQGTAAAYDLVKFGEAGRIIMADVSLVVAKASAARVNKLTGSNIAEAVSLDVRNPQALRDILGPVDGALSAVPYYLNLEITKAAIAAQTHLCDLGGHTDVVLTQLALDHEARQAAISIVPDCGMGPGLINTMAAYTMSLLNETHEIHIYDGGLSQVPVPPWNYQLTFHINGLTNEMDGQAIYLRKGKITRIDTLTEPEYIEFPPFGRLEADVTSGGSSTAPWNFEGKLQVYENKTLRYPGHFEWLRAFKALGLFSEIPIIVHSQEIIPRQVFHALLEPKITAPVVKDVCVIRVNGRGIKNGRPAEITVDLIDYFENETGFSAMERLTGWHCAIMLSFQVHGFVKQGCNPVETAVPPELFMQELPRRGIHYQVRSENFNISP